MAIQQNQYRVHPLLGGLVDVATPGYGAFGGTPLGGPGAGIGTPYTGYGNGFGTPFGGYGAGIGTPFSGYGGGIGAPYTPFGGPLNGAGPGYYGGAVPYGAYPGLADADE